ncbi:MAG: hypothetical protein HQ510_09630 [Candidatus Marinimicrobia bacterium]|nr:hypothetical protein [Candidatus Neomarinimicrobiota bacterium]
MTEKQHIHQEHDHCHHEPSKNWTGILFIFLGAFLLLQTTNVIDEIDNWWALFVISPGVATYLSAFQQYRSTRKVTIRLIDRITSGTFITFVGFILLLDWQWSKIWPVFLIIIGLEYLLKNYIRNGRHNQNNE